MDPQIFLRNATSAPVTATITVDWRSNTTSGRLPLPVPMLAANEVRVLNRADLVKSGQQPADATWATVTVSHQGRSGDLVPIAVSYDRTARYGLQTPFSETTSPLWKGSMWHVDATQNTLITTGNGDTKLTHAAMTLFYNGGQGSYTIEKSLQPGEQIWADVGQIIRNQIPDKNGATIPPRVMSGSYELRDLDNIALGRLYEGKLVLDKTWGHGYYGCGRCCGWRPPGFNPNPFTSGVGSGTPDTLTAANACTNVNHDFTVDGYNWGSNNTAVATVANAYTNLVGFGSATGDSFLDLVSNSGKYCPDATFNPSGAIKAGKKVDLIGATCNVSPIFSFIANWGDFNNLTQCAISEPLSVPQGGYCIDGSTTVTFTDLSLNGPPQAIFLTQPTQLIESDVLTFFNNSQGQLVVCAASDPFTDNKSSNDCPSLGLHSTLVAEDTVNGNTFILPTTGSISGLRVNFLSDATSVTQTASDVVTLTAAPVPEPSSFLLIGTGLLGAAGAVRRKLFS